jgi:hypothetical protein
VCKAIVQGVQHDFLVVFRYLDGQQLVLRQQSELNVANALVELCCAQKKWWTEVLVGSLLTFKLPGQLRRIGGQPVGRFSLAE